MKLRTVKKTIGRRRRGRATSLWNILTGRWGKQHRLPAHVTGEGDWEVEVPQIRMSRAFAVMLVLHIVAVGGLFAFRIWGKDDDGKGQTAENTTAPAALVEPAVPAVTGLAAAEESVLGSEAAVTDPAEPLKTYVWHTGDTLPLVAARFGVSGSALREANPDKQLLPGTELVIPRAGRVFGGADTSNAEAGPAEIFDPAKSTIAAPSLPPRAVVVQELAAFPEIPDVLPSHADETASPMVQKVSTRAPAKPALAKNDEITGGKKKAAITIPPARTAGLRAHVVTSGDTVFNIAKRYGFTAAEIAKANSLGDGYRIRKGQQLRIPVRR